MVYTAGVWNVFYSCKTSFEVHSKMPNQNIIDMFNNEWIVWKFLVTHLRIFFLNTFISFNFIGSNFWRHDWYDNEAHPSII